MCGIAGVIAPSGLTLGDDYRDALSSASLAIARRGPDGEGFWEDSRAMLAHRRLAIIDPDPRSNQPMESSNWVISYNGEIYNFRTIRAELVAGGQTFRTQSDSEVLLLALEKWGIEGCLSRVAGMFGFIAYNKTTGIAYLARDHLGIKPVIYSTDQRGAIFVASSVTAILAAQPAREFKVHRRALGSYFALGGTMTNQTCYRGIYRLPPAHYMEIMPNGDNKLVKYWEPQYQPNFTMDDLVSVVREYETADVPSAMFLSGGVDSSFLATIFNNLDCFHLVSPEEQYARAVAERFDRKFIAVKPQLDDYEAAVGEAIAFHGEPLMSVGIPLAVSKEMSNHGYSMAISANGADELFHGYPRTPMPEHRPAYLPLHEPPNYDFLGQQLAHIFRDSRNFDIPALREEIPSMIDIATRAMSTYTLSGFPESASHRWLELMTYVLCDLNPTLDAASMYHSIEVRLPFLDHRVVQGVLSWDASVLVTATQGRKAPLKDRLIEYFPQSLYQRTKLGFSIHSDQLEDISRLANKALADAIDDGFLQVKSGKKFGEYSRDMIYLGSCLFGYSKWRGRTMVSELP